jgi:hypothetical protein
MLICMGNAKSEASEAAKQAQLMSFHIDFEISISQHEGDPSDYITIYHGHIIGMMGDDSERKIGKLTLYLVERGRVLNDGISLFEWTESCSVTSR